MKKIDANWNTHPTVMMGPVVYPRPVVDPKIGDARVGQLWKPKSEMADNHHYENFGCFFIIDVGEVSLSHEVHGEKHSWNSKIATGLQTFLDGSMPRKAFWELGSLHSFFELIGEGP